MAGKRGIVGRNNFLPKPTRGHLAPILRPAEGSASPNFALMSFLVLGLYSDFSLWGFTLILPQTPAPNNQGLSPSAMDGLRIGERSPNSRLACHASTTSSSQLEHLQRESGLQPSLGGGIATARKAKRRELRCKLRGAELSSDS